MNKKTEKRRLIAVGRIFSRRDIEALTKTGNGWWWLAIIVLTALIVASRSFAPTTSYEVGDICQSDIYYEGPVLSYMSEVRYAEAVRNIEENTPMVYHHDGGAMVEQAKANITNLITSLIPVVNDHNTEDKTSLYQGILIDHYSKEMMADLEAVGSDRLYQLETIIDNLIDTYFGDEDGVKEEDLTAVIDAMKGDIAKHNYKEAEENVLLLLVDIANLRATLEEDESAWEANKQALISRIDISETIVSPGQIICRRGSPITAEHLEMLDKTGLLEASKGPPYYVGILGVVFILYLLLFLFCRRYYPFFAHERQGILLLGSLCVSYILICQVIMTITVSSSGVVASILGYFMPLPAMAILFTTLISHRFAYFTTALLSLFMALMSTSQLSYIIVGLTCAYYTVRIVMRVRERFQLVKFGCYIGVLCAVLVALLGLIGGQSIRIIGLGMLVGLGNGILSAFIALGILPIIEKYFGFTTPMQLMELASPGNPLIRRLMTEAPGTYYHSVLVGNLAEAAADDIGADSLLVRVASYFHDIGKLVRPGYFAENQEPGKNPHEKLTPSLSALIIISHVKDGVEMARANNLPENIVQIIAEHHGATVTKYFYHQEVENVGEENVDIAAFTYPGPKPQTKESALIMMADSVQAALQSRANQSELTKEDINQKVDEILQAQLADSQFEDCNLTFRDITKIKKAFCSVFYGLSHYRIVYPDEKATDDLSLLANTLFDNDGQPILTGEPVADQRGQNLQEEPTTGDWDEKSKKT